MKILIADDESFVLDGLTRLLSQNIPGVEVVTADNGQSALEQCAESAPDLLITDVSMPLMDGVELSRALREWYPDCRIMIISGYADFQAARSAIEFGALRYMLKPINHAEMVEYVRSVVDEVRREKVERERRLTDRVDSLLLELHNHLLQGIPYHGTERIEEEEGEYCVVKLAPVGAPASGADNAQAIEAALLRSAQGRAAAAYPLRTAKGQLTVLLCGYVQEDNAWLEGLPAELNTALGYPVAVGVGCSCKTLESLHLSYRAAGMAEWRAYLAGGGETYFDGAVQDEDDEENPLDAVFRLRQDVRRMVDFYNLIPDDQQLLYAVNTFLARLERIDCPFSMQQLMCAELVTDLLGGSYVAGLEPDADIKRYLCLDVYTACRGYADLRETMISFVNLYNDLLEKINRSGSSRLILSIRAAIHADLRNASLSHVADTLNMSPSYISMIFKEKTGQNFKDYLLTTRMSHARRLLRQGEPIYEIARKLGYEDAEHFSRRFRERFGLSPAAYRKEGGEGAPEEDNERKG